MNGPTIVIRFFFLVLASIMGFYGLIMGISWLIIHILNLRSFGIPQLTTADKLQFQNIKDDFIRAPWWQMILRPQRITNNQKRMANEGDKKNE